MKLAATALAVSLSMFGCATDNDGEGGAYLDGLRPAKPSLDEVVPQIRLNPAVDFILKGGLWNDVKKGQIIHTPDGDVSAEYLTPPFPIEGLCKACKVIALQPLETPDEIYLTDNFGRHLCRIWIDPKDFVAESPITKTDCH